MRLTSGPVMRTALLCAWLGGAAPPAPAAGEAKPATADAAKPGAFQAPVRPPVPAVADKCWVRNPIDAFVLARLERAGLAPSPPADPATLIRRVIFDLTGLPPTPEEVEAF